MLTLGTPIHLGFGYGFGYARVTDRRPEVAVRFASIDEHGRLIQQARVGCLVDSGADETMLNEDIAADLGLDVGRMPQVPVQGIGNAVTYGGRHTVLAQLCYRWLLIPVIFAKNQRPNLLGRAGAFDALRLVFLHGASAVLADAHP